MQSRSEIKDFIVQEFLPGGAAIDIEDDFDLISNGIIDSLGVLNLISFLEGDLGLRIEPEDMDSANYATVNKIQSFIESKRVAA